MTGVITRAAFVKAQWPGIRAIFGASYNDHVDEWSKIFEEVTSDKSYEEEFLAPGFGLVPEKAEGGAVAYDSHQQGYVARYTNVTYAMGFIVTQEEDEDGQYKKLQMKRAKMLARSFKQTKETVGANILNRAFNSSYTGGDGKELCATDHPSQVGSQSNELAVAADLSEKAIEDLAIQIENAVDDRGLKIALKPRCLVVPPALKFEAYRLYESELQPGTANNDINAMGSMKLFPKGICVNHYLSDADAWFILTDCPDGLKHQKRVKIDFTDDTDFDTTNRKYKGRERYTFGWSDWRGVYASSGA